MRIEMVLEDCCHGLDGAGAAAVWPSGFAGRTLLYPAPCPRLGRSRRRARSRRRGVGNLRSSCSAPGRSRGVPGRRISVLFHWPTPHFIVGGSSHLSTLGREHVCYAISGHRKVPGVRDREDMAGGPERNRLRPAPAGDTRWTTSTSCMLGDACRSLGPYAENEALAHTPGSVVSR